MGAALTLEVDGRSFDGGASGSQWIGRDALEGWWDSPEIIGEDEQVLGDRDGAFDPVAQFVGPRRVNVILEVESPTVADARDYRHWANSLSKKDDVSFRVKEDDDQWLSLRKAKIRGLVKNRPNRRNLRLTQTMFTVWSADPRKYGEMKRDKITAIAPVKGGLTFPIVAGSLAFSASGSVTFPGVFHIENPGEATFYPTFTVVGPMNGFVIVSGTHVIQYQGVIGAGSEVVLSPQIGGRAVIRPTGSTTGTDVSQNLTEASWLPVGPNETLGFLFTADAPGAASELIIDYPNGAWI